MPPKFRFTREEIVNAALALTEEGGPSAVTARALAARLGSSAKPIFGLFESMEALQRAVLAAAFEKYERFLAAEMARGEYKPYKASGMAYIHFARDERELFKLLFMRERSREEQRDTPHEDVKPLLRLICQNTGMTEAEAARFHTEMWLLVHGIATMIATSFLDWSDEDISRALTDVYEGMTRRGVRKEGEE